MSQSEKLVAFQAAIGLLKDRGMEDVIKAYRKILGMKSEGTMHERNVVQEIFEPFTEDEISAKITEIVKPEGFDVDLDIVYLPLEQLSRLFPITWEIGTSRATIYRSNRIVNQAFLNFYEGKSERAYQFVM